jgi:hypothetical protein
MRVMGRGVDSRDIVALWEYVGEWREQASINDLVVTPVSGVPVGESFFHLGALAAVRGPAPPNEGPLPASQSSRLIGSRICAG